MIFSRKTAWAGLVLAFSLTVGAQLPADSDGLTVVNGMFMKDGHPFYGVGINYFNVLIRMTGLAGSPPDLSPESYRQGFETLRKYEIPFIRFCAGGFYPKDWDLYLKDKKAYFRIFDRLVMDAEKKEIGLIPSLFWNFPAVPDLAGEPLDQWGNPDSKTIAFMRQYTTEVVSRYKDSPAIWGWEFGNEYLHAVVPQPELGRGAVAPHLGTPSERTARDKMLRPIIWTAYREFSKTVRSIDKTRPVFTGDTVPRPAAFHIWKESSWRMDSQEEWQSVFLKDNESMNTLSVHFYYYSRQDEIRDSGLMEFGPEDQLEFMMKTARSSGKPLYIGEFGAAAKEKTEEEERRQFELMLGLLVTNQVQLSALWNFDFEDPDQVLWNITEKNHRAYMLEALRTANRKMRTAGSQQGIPNER
jgi:hypothetical protein